MKIAAALREVRDAETALADELARLGERHANEPDVFHLARTLHAWSDHHLQALAPHAAHYGPGPPLGPVRRAAAEEEAADPGLRLLGDLRHLHLAAARASLAWTVLGQGAQAVADDELLATVTACHPETVRTLKWTVQKVKEASPQVLAS